MRFILEMSFFLHSAITNMNSVHSTLRVTCASLVCLHQRHCRFFFFSGTAAHKHVLSGTAAVALGGGCSMYLGVTLHPGLRQRVCILFWKEEQHAGIIEGM